MPANVGIQISKALRARLPDKERKSADDVLWKKSGQKCFLCGGHLNRSAHVILADHDLPEAEGGKTELSNLHLVHASCNSWKRNHPTAPAKNFLPFKTFLEEKKGSLVYADCLPFFHINPKKCTLERKGDVLEIDMPDGTNASAQVYSEINSRGTFEYCFTEVPIEAIFNDERCQPRTIKSKQVWSIFSDLQSNPLHEPPSCRVEKSDGDVPLLMFDGQHKTISTILMKRQRLVVKIYLGLSEAPTRHLVNSIQAKIPKLPLSAMELMNKMGGEYRDKLSEYIEEIPETEASEEGFIDWLPADQRARGKQAFENACIKTIWDEEGVDLHDFVGEHSKEIESLTESTARNKLLRPLIRVKPLPHPFEEGETIRGQEKEIVTRILDDFVKVGLRPKNQPPTADDKASIHRRAYQSSLAYVAGLIRKSASRILKIDEADSLGSVKPTKPQLKEIEGAVRLIVEHPVWTHPYNTKRMRAVEDALSKNQNAEKAFRDVGLTIGYVTSGGDLDPRWAG